MSARSPGQRTATLALWIVLAFCPLRVVHASARIFLDIPSGPAEKTLANIQQYTSQFGFQGMVYGTDAVRGIRTNEVHGEFGFIEALKVMTRGTRLRVDFSGADTVTVTVQEAQAALKHGVAVHALTSEVPADRRSVVQTVTVTASKAHRPTIQQLASPTRILKRADIDAFGFATTQDVIRTLPQVFGGGPTQDTHIGFEAGTNAGLGAGVNLRGLGAGSTLTLMNGRRLPASGTDGVFSDISGIPLSVVEQIEILPDSSSSEFGADAVGGVVNFVLLDSFDGAQTNASFGAATHGSFDQNRVSQLIGIKSRAFDGLLAFDLYGRDALHAAERDQARSDLTAFGGSNFDSNQSNPATITQGLLTWAVPRGQDGLHLDPSMLIPNEQHLENKYEGADLLPSQQRWSLYGTGKKNVTDEVQLFADALFSQRGARSIGSGVRLPFDVPSTNAFYVNPTGLPLPVHLDYNLVDDLGPLTTNVGVRTMSFVLGADSHWDNGWRITATSDFASEHLRARTENLLNPLTFGAALADSNRATAFNPFGDGSHTSQATLDRIRGSGLFTTNSHMWAGDITARREFNGPFGGHGKFSTGVDYRDQTFASMLLTPGDFQNVAHDMRRKVEAGFIAMTVPLLGGGSAQSAANRLEVSMAGRYEHYSDFGNTLTPRFGLTWAPLDDLVLRGTLSNSFRPPSLIDLDESHNIVTFFPVTDPTAPGSQSLVLVKAGKNARLSEERARSWTLGFDADFDRVPGLSTAFTYFHTRFTDRTSTPSPTSALLTDPAVADLLTLNPTIEQRQAVCNSAPFFGPAGTCMVMPIRALADLRVRNRALTLTQGVDLLAEYSHYSNSGTMTLRLDGTYVLSFAEAQSQRTPLLERVSTQNYPVDLRLRGSFDWQRGPMRASALVTYFDDYRDIASQRHVSSWTTLDLNFSYSFDHSSNPALSGTTFALSAENVFNKDPPFLNNPVGIGYDQENGELTGRILSFSVRKNW